MQLDQVDLPYDPYYNISSKSTFFENQDSQSYLPSKPTNRVLEYSEQETTGMTSKNEKSGSQTQIKAVLSPKVFVCGQNSKKEVKFKN